jgi:hypothetical protein
LLLFGWSGERANSLSFGCDGAFARHDVVDPGQRHADVLGQSIGG